MNHQCILTPLNAAIIALILLQVVLISGQKCGHHIGKRICPAIIRVLYPTLTSNHVTSLFQTLLLGLISQLYIKHKSKPNFLRMK